MMDARFENLNQFRFKDLHPHLYLGTASDRYAGWIGQIYSPDRYIGRVTRRRKTVGKTAFTEEVLPVDSLEEYFEHFRVLELDFTFYGLLREPAGNPTKTHRVLETYRQHLKPGDRLILKAPQLTLARKIRQGNGYVDNDKYLDAETYVTRFYDPATRLLDPWLTGIVFEQEYHRKQDRVALTQFSNELEEFFSNIPWDSRYHMELRTEAYWSEPVFRVLEAHGIGQVLSHWTWLPSLPRQFALYGNRVLNAAGTCVIRLMTPLGLRYEEAYGRAHPFDQLKQDMLNEQALAGTVDLVRDLLKDETDVNVIINNRYGGNAPLVARKIAQQFLSFFI